MNQYLQRLRLLQAVEWLVEEPKEPLARIAVDCGFASHSHLSTAFRQTFNMSPSRFRRAANRREMSKMRKMLKV
jgi:transcriptional regulator GlxA family with amidase domain